jgi:hypothetical protein
MGWGCGSFLAIVERQIVNNKSVGANIPPSFPLEEDTLLQSLKKKSWKKKNAFESGDLFFLLKKTTWMNFFPKRNEKKAPSINILSCPLFTQTTIKSSFVGSTQELLDIFCCDLA